jgi:hypothetical protein
MNQLWKSRHEHPLEAEEIKVPRTMEPRAPLLGIQNHVIFLFLSLRKGDCAFATLSSAHRGHTRLLDHL